MAKSLKNLGTKLTCIYTFRKQQILSEATRERVLRALLTDTEEKAKQRRFLQSLANLQSPDKCFECRAPVPPLPSLGPHPKTSISTPICL